MRRGRRTHLGVGREACYRTESRSRSRDRAGADICHRSRSRIKKRSISIS